MAAAPQTVTSGSAVAVCADDQCVAVLPSGATDYITGLQRVSIRLLKSGAEVCSFTYPSGWIRGASFAPRGDTFAAFCDVVRTGSGGPRSGLASEVNVWDAHTGSLRWQLPPGGYRVRSLAYDPTGQFVALGTEDDPAVPGDTAEGHVELRRADTGALVVALARAKGPVKGLCFSADGTMIRRIGEYGEVSSWRVSSGERQATATLVSGVIRDVAIDRTGRVAALGEYGGKLYVVDLTRLATVRVLNTHAGPVSALALSPDCSQAATFQDDGVVRLWQLGDDRLQATFMPVGETDYLVTTPDHYYMASRGGLRAVGFRVGEDTYSFEQFDLRLNRPDLVLEKLGKAPAVLIQAYHRAYLRRLERMKIAPESFQERYRLPEVRLPRDLPLTTVERTLSFTVEASDADRPIDSLQVFVNDVPVFRGGIDLHERNANALTYPVTIELSAGRNRIEVSARNRDLAESLAQTFDVVCTAPARPALYVLAVGVSRFRDRRVPELKYAAKDATDTASFFENALPASGPRKNALASPPPQHATAAQRNGAAPRQQRSRKPWDNVRKWPSPAAATGPPEAQPASGFAERHVLRIVDDDATSERIRQAKEFLRQARPDDQVIVFLAGHGVVDTKLDYYYLTYDTDAGQIPTTSLAYREIEDLLDGLAARRKLLLIDTCYSGELETDGTAPVLQSQTGPSLQQVGRAPRGAAVPSKNGSGASVRLRSLTPPTEARSGLGLQNTLQVLPDLFTDLRRGCGAQVISAASGLETAAEDARWRNGVFTFAVLEGLRSGAADSNHDGKVQVSELREYVTNRVLGLTGGVQRPTCRRENLESDFSVDTP